jgi:sugar phosphate isomerase/epimerase
MAQDVPTGVFNGANFQPGDMPSKNWVPVGKGRIDYKSVFQEGKQIGVKWYILEMDKYDGDVYAAVASSLAYIQKEKMLQ